MEDDFLKTFQQGEPHETYLATSWRREHTHETLPQRPSAGDGSTPQRVSALDAQRRPRSGDFEDTLPHALPTAPSHSLIDTLPPRGEKEGEGRAGEEAPLGERLSSTEESLPALSSVLLPVALQETLTPPAEELHQPGERFLSQTVLGEGSFGSVFVARDRIIGRDIAVKKFHSGDNPALVQSWHDEVRLTGRIEHPRIPTIYDAGFDEGNPYVVMRYLDGEPLSVLIQRLQSADQEAHERYPFATRIELLIQLLRILTVSHEQGILHRDIKPDNILLSRDGELYLLDWGIAIDLNEQDGSGALSGTPAYLSPEQARGEPLDLRSDLYSVACVAYELITLTPSAPRESELEPYLRAICEELPKFPEWVVHPSQGSPPAEICHQIWRGLQKAPADRWQSAQAFLSALERVQSGHFDICCPRTLAKRNLHNLMRWLDRGLSHILWFYLFISLGIFVFLRGIISFF